MGTKSTSKSLISSSGMLVKRQSHRFLDLCQPIVPLSG